MNDADARNAGLIRSALFRKEREQGWKRLEALLARVEKDGVRSLSAREARDLPLLYRAALSSLSVAGSIALDRNLLRYLQNLSLRAYLAVYGPRVGIGEQAARFLRAGFPGAVRGLRWHLLVAAVLLFAGVAAGYALAWHDAGYYFMLIPESLAGGRVPGASAAELREHLFESWPGFVNAFVVFANSLFRHNAVVGILSFGLGFMLGLPTAFLLVYNGMIIGAMIELHAERGLAYDFVGWLAVHGVTEISAILLCGAAGFSVAEKIVFPGRFSRLENLALGGRQAAGAAAGAVGMLFIAGIFEGGFRQLIDNTPARYAFALLTAAAWAWYFLSRTEKAGNNGDDK